MILVLKILKKNIGMLLETLIILDLVTLLKKVLIVFITNKNTGYQHADDKPC